MFIIGGGITNTLNRNTDPTEFLRVKFLRNLSIVNEFFSEKEKFILMQPLLL